MAFRDDFINGYLMTPVGPRKRDFAQWSLENTVDSGFRASNKQAQAANQHLVSAFQSRIQHLADSQMQAAKLLQRELQYQMDGLTSTTDRGFADVVSAIQSTCDYLGGQLCEVRWAIERQTQVSQQLLHVLLTSLDNTSRQYYEQGVKWYEDSEYDLAKERLQLALKENSRNSFAYQYLGFIAVNREESQEALRNFELARKAAENAYHKALALSHLARSYNAVGELPKALQCSTSAAQVAPDHAKFWYESAVYYVRSGITAEAVKCLRRAISTDWVYWSISVTDSNLEPVRPSVQELLLAMREEQRTIARKCLDQVKQTAATLGGMQISSEVAEYTRTLSQCETKYREGTVFAYRDLVPIVQQAQKKALETAIKVLEQRLTANRADLVRYVADQRQDVNKASGRISSVESQADSRAGSHSFHGGFGCLIAVGVLVLIVGGMAYNGDTSVGQRPLESRVVVMKWGAGIIAFGLLVPLLIKLVSATLPAAGLRLQIPKLKREFERTRNEAEANISRETTRLDSALNRLNQQKQMCQNHLKALC